MAILDLPLLNVFIEAIRTYDDKNNSNFKKKT